MRRAAILLLLCPLAILGCGGGVDEEAAPSTTASASNAEESIEGFGREAEGTQRVAMVATFRGYLKAISAKDTAGACSYLSMRVRGAMARLASNDTQPGCARLLASLLSAKAPAVAKLQVEGEIKKVRSRSDMGFIVFYAPGAHLYQQNLAHEDDGWKVASLSPSVLTP